MRLPRLLALCGVLAFFAMGPLAARAADTPPSTRDARVALIWQEQVGADPSAQLP